MKTEVKGAFESKLQQRSRDRDGDPAAPRRGARLDGRPDAPRGPGDALGRGVPRPRGGSCRAARGRRPA
jgi:hypothetical protein